MRILSGKSHGRALKVPRRYHVRPTSAKVKEALFSILASQILEARFLDLYSGSGAVGIEALSRGAFHVDFVENDSLPFSTLLANLMTCGYEKNSHAHRSSVHSFIRRLDPNHTPFDIVFADPPYQSPTLKKLLPQLARGVKLSASGIIIIEHYRKIALPDLIDSLKLFCSKRYGDTVLSFYRKT